MARELRVVALPAVGSAPTAADILGFLDEHPEIRGAVLATGECRHNFVVDGLRYTHSDFPMPGGGAKRRHYFRLFRCISCFERRAERLEYTDDSYGKVQFDAEPASGEERQVMR